MQPNSFLAFIGIVMVIMALGGGVLLEGNFGEENKQPVSPTTQPVINNTTGFWVRELDETGTAIIFSGPIGTSATTFTYPYNVKENATESYINLTWTNKKPGDDLDLTVYNAKGDTAGASGNAPGQDEQVHLKKNDMKKGGIGEWEAEVQAFAGVLINFQITVDVYYLGNNTTANSTIAKKNLEETKFLYENFYKNIEFILKENKAGAKWD